jgi:hypothetical protein
MSRWPTAMTSAASTGIRPASPAMVSMVAFSSRIRPTAWDAPTPLER